MMIRIGLFLAVLVGFCGLAAAQTQTGGAFCVRSFEDPNANGKRDPNERALTGGVSVNLLDAGGITIASALLDDSPNAAQGMVCFQFLQAGQYSIVVTSADFAPTTTDTVTANVTADGQPTLVEYGAQRPAAASNLGGSRASATDSDQLLRLVISALGTLVVVVLMVFLGFIVYMMAFRGRKPPATAALDPRKTTGSISAVRARDTGEFPKP